LFVVFENRKNSIPMLSVSK